MVRWCDSDDGDDGDETDSSQLLGTWHYHIWFQILSPANSLSLYKTLGCRWRSYQFLIAICSCPLGENVTRYPCHSPEAEHGL